MEQDSLGGWFLKERDVAGGANVGLEADNSLALPVQTPTLVLELLHADNRPREVVTELVGEAMAVTEGEIPNVEELQAQMVAAEQQAREHPDRFQDARR